MYGFSNSLTGIVWDLARAASEVASVSAVFLYKSGERLFQLGARKDQRAVSFEILLLTFELPVPTPKREARGSASEREVGHREVVKFPGHDLLVCVFVGEWRNVFFLKRAGGRVSIACTFGEVKPLKYTFGKNEFKNLLGEFHTMSTVYATNVHCTLYS